MYWKTPAYVFSERGPEIQSNIVTVRAENTLFLSEGRLGSNPHSEVLFMSKLFKWEGKTTHFSLTKGPVTRGCSLQASLSLPRSN